MMKKTQPLTLKDDERGQDQAKPKLIPKQNPQTYNE